MVFSAGLGHMARFAIGNMKKPSSNHNEKSTTYFDHVRSLTHGSLSFQKKSKIAVNWGHHFQENHIGNTMFSPPKRYQRCGSAELGIFQ
jgi:hypothetical protein